MLEQSVPKGRVLTLKEFLLTGVSSMTSIKVTKNLGMLLLGIWLIMNGVIRLLNLGFSGMGTLMAVLAVAAGALVITGR